MKELKDQYGDKVEIVELDASAPTLKDGEAPAKAYGVYGFLRDSADWVPIVGIFSGRRKLLKELVGPNQKNVYVAAIDKALRVSGLPWRSSGNCAGGSEFVRPSKHYRFPTGPSFQEVGRCPLIGVLAGGLLILSGWVFDYETLKNPLAFEGKMHSSVSIAFI